MKHLQLRPLYVRSHMNREVTVINQSASPDRLEEPKLTNKKLAFSLQQNTKLLHIND